MVGNGSISLLPAQTTKRHLGFWLIQFSLLYMASLDKQAASFAWTEACKITDESRRPGWTLL